MSDELTRRRFLALTPAALTFARPAVAGADVQGTPLGGAAAARVKLEAFDYGGVRLLPSRWQRQYQAARAFYASVGDDDILHGFRAAAGRPAPGRPLGGWCGKDSSTVFGQWLSGMARMARATGDAQMRDKAVRLFRDWSGTIKPDGDCGMRHYAFDKLVCGLLDLARYADHADAVAALEKVVAFAQRSFSRENELADPAHEQRYYGRPQEWYTLGENLLRAHALTGDPKLREFALVWMYPAYWHRFADTISPAAAHGVHAYSHVNSFSSAALAYETGADASLLRVIRNAHDYLQRYQCYATGGYGPNERFMAPDGSLGRALDTRSDTSEIVCGSWAAFKLARYLVRLTGEARFGDWIERLLYNGVGAALPIAEGGRNFYYADYRVGGGMKVYNWERYTCCSGTYIQNVVEYHNLIYFRDADDAREPGLYVNLYLPSELSWDAPFGQVTLVQETGYPDGGAASLTLRLREPARFPLRFRMPTWSEDVSLRVNGAAAGVPCTPGTWATVARVWRDGDRVDVTIPLALRMEAVDVQHPDRVAVVRGPVVLVLEGAYHDPRFRLPEIDEDLERWLVAEPWKPASGVHGVSEEPNPDERVRIFRVEPPGGTPARLRFRPFYDVAEGYPYFVYFDRRAHPWRLW
jgi:DUF1680 family protein